MVEGEAGTIVPVVAQDPAPVVDGAKKAETAGEGTNAPKPPGWTLQLKEDQQAALKARIAADPAALEKLPKGLPELYAQFDQLSSQSAGALKRPPKDAPKEAWDQFFKELGRPESAEGYTLEKPQIPSGMRYDDKMEQWFRAVAHSRGLTQEQAQGFFSEWNKAQMDLHQAASAARKAQADAVIQGLKEKWGNDFATKWEEMRQAYLQFVPGGETGKLYQKIKAHELDNDPDFLEMFQNIYKKIGPPKFVVPSGEGKGAEEKPGFTFKVPKGRE